MRCHVSTGSCAITFNSDQYQFSKMKWTNVTGSIGATIFPGSDRVLNRSSNMLELCTVALCPLAVLSAQTKQLVNYAPTYCVLRSYFSFASTPTGEGVLGTTGFFQYLNTEAYQSYVIPLLQVIRPPTPTPAGNITSANSSAPAAPRTGYDIQPLLDFGYTLNDTLNFLPAFVRGYTHKNQLQDITLPGAAYFRCGPPAGCRLLTTMMLGVHGTAVPSHMG
jgi:hypothetical protein